MRLDRSVPVLLVKLHRNPQHHGGLAIVRSFGRAGVPVYAMTEDPFTPVARSRYLAGRFGWPAGAAGHVGGADAAGHVGRIVARLAKIAAAVGAAAGRPAVAVPTDDAAAVVLAEHAADLRGHLLLPRVPQTLPRTLADKRSLYELCLRSGVPTPRTAFPASLEEAVSCARQLTYPVVAKNTEPWASQAYRHVASTTVIRTEPELVRRLDGSPDLRGLLLQEYLPHEHAEDWFVAVYADADSTPVAQFVGRKARAWPPHAGVTVDGRAAANPTIAELTAALVRDVGWRGVADVEWRLDRRDGRYLLVDFNVRVGAQFRCGQTADGLDVVRAMHLDLTGRPVPPARQDYTRRLVVGHLLFPSTMDERLTGGRHTGGRLASRTAVNGSHRTERSWLAADDPVPGIVMTVRGIRPVAAALLHTWRTRHRRP